MSEQESRAGQLNAVIDPRLLFLVRRVARFKKQSTVKFLEGAITRALNEEAISERIAEMWSEDRSEQLFNLGNAQVGIDLLFPAERTVFNAVTGTLVRQRKELTLKNFVRVFKNQASA